VAYKPKLNVVINKKQENVHIEHLKVKNEHLKCVKCSIDWVLFFRKKEDVSTSVPKLEQLHNFMGNE